MIHARTIREMIGRPIRPLARFVVRWVFSPKLTLDPRLSGLTETILVPNHPSVFDPVVLFGYLPAGTWYTATEKIALRYRLLRVLQILPVYWLPADGLRKADFAALIGVAKSGRNLVVFPQADTAPPGSEFTCFPGFYRIARKAGRSMTFVRIRGTNEVVDWEVDRRIRRGVNVSIEVTEVLPHDVTEREAIEAFRRVVEG